MENFSLSYPLFLIKKISLNFNLKIFLIFEILLIVFLLISALFQTNIITTLGYQLQDFQRKANEISQENKSLEIDFAKINSLKNIEEKVQQLGFEKINKVYYLEIIESSVAAK